MTSAILIRGGRIIDGTGAAPRSGAVLLRDGKIAATDADADRAAANLQDVQLIDATGKSVMPGLIDAHCHISFDEPASNDELFFHRRANLAAIIAAANARKLLRAGVTAFLDADSIFEIGIDLRDAIEGGVVPGPRMATGGYALVTSVGGTAGQLIPDEGTAAYARVVRTRDEIVTEVRRQIKAGVDWIKVHVTGLVPRRLKAGEVLVWSLDELKAVCDTAHALGIPVTGHCRNAASTRAAVEAGFDMILHGTHMDDATLEKVVKHQVPLVPTLTFQANLADYGDRIGADPVLQDIFRREIEESATQLRRAYDAGVPLLCGSESGFSLTPYGHWHAREMEVFVKHLGLTPLQAIRCATADGARAMGLAGELGVIAAGALADVIVVDGDPSTDITVLGDPARIVHVIARGVPVDLPPDPPRRPIPGWRVAQYGQILTRARALGGTDSA